MTMQMADIPWNEVTSLAKALVDRGAFEGSALPALPRAPEGSSWVLDPDMLMKVAHDIQTVHGWDTSMETVELAMLAAEKLMGGQVAT